MGRIHSRGRLGFSIYDSSLSSFSGYFEVHFFFNFNFGETNSNRRAGTPMHTT